uniref:protein S100-A1-like n=1 Tax=Myxine glutinosa TaxID=7769 RepID=UPI00358DFF8D
MSSTDLQSAMETMVAVFHKYSGKEGDRYKLSKAEMKDLLTNELPGVLTGAKNAETVESIMEDLDVDKDGEVDFNEYSVLLAALSVACNEFFMADLKHMCGKA